MHILTETIYKLTVKGNMKMTTAQDSFTIVSEYKLMEIIDENKPRSNGKEYILDELKVELAEYFNPVTMQIMDYVNKLAKIYERQHLVISDDRKIVEILNIQEIRQKWEVLKKELMLINPISAFEVVRGKDKEMHDLDLIKENLSNTHFMYLFLYAYGYQLTEGKKYEEQREERDRMGVGFYIPLTLMFGMEREKDNYNIYTKSILNSRKKVDLKLIAKVTGQDGLELSHLNKGIYSKNNKNQLTAAEIEIYEQIHNDYKADYFIRLETLDHKSYG